MKLSIIIPVLNQEKLIVKAINSIPLRDDIEIIVVNDGSTDGTLKAVKKIKRDIVIVNLDKNYGVGYADNRGIDIAKGEYIMRLDSDDYLYPEAFLKALERLDGTDIIYYDLINNEGRRYHGTPENARRYHSGALKFVRREFLGDMRNDENLRFIEDRDLYDRLIKKNPTEKSLGLIVTHYNFPRVNSLCYLEGARLRKRTDFDIVFYYNGIQEIGGIETWLYSIARKYNDLEIAIYYKTGHPNQIERLSRIVPTIKWEHQKVKCRTFIFCWSYEMLNSVTAENYFLWVHGDFKALNIRMTIPYQTTAIYGVAKHVVKSFIEMHQDQLNNRTLKVDYVYNPFIKENVKRKRRSDKIRLISPTRLTREKGWERMKILANHLRQKGIDFEWHVYSREKYPATPNFTFFEPKLDILQEIADSDYLVQLSDSEGMPYAVWESLSVGTPVIVTDIPAIREMNLTNQAIVLSLDMSDIEKVKDLKRKRIKFKPPQNDKRYREVLLGEKEELIVNKDSKFIVKDNGIAKKLGLTDSTTKSQEHPYGRVRALGEQWEVDYERLQVLLGDNDYRKAFVEIVKEIPKPKRTPSQNLKKSTSKTAVAKKVPTKKSSVAKKATEQKGKYVKQYKNR